MIQFLTKRIQTQLDKIDNHLDTVEKNTAEEPNTVGKFKFLYWVKRLRNGDPEAWLYTGLGVFLILGIMQVFVHLIYFMLLPWLFKVFMGFF